MVDKLDLSVGKVREVPPDLLSSSKGCQSNLEILKQSLQDCKIFANPPYLWLPLAGAIHFRPHLLRLEHEQEVGGLADYARSPRAADRIGVAEKILPGSGEFGRSNSHVLPRQVQEGLDKKQLAFDINT